MAARAAEAAAGGWTVTTTMKPADFLSSLAKLGLCALVLAARGDLSAQGSATPDREYTLISTMLGYRGAGGDIAGLRNPTLWAKTGETVKLTIVNGELMVHDIALEKAGPEEHADPRQGRNRQHHVQGEEQRYLFLLAARASRRGHGGASRGHRHGADRGPRHRARGQRPAARSRLRIRDARELDGHRRRLPGRAGRRPL